MRTRSQSRFVTLADPDYGNHAEQHNNRFERMQDFNNGASRPESPCALIKCWADHADPLPLSGRGTTTFNRSAADYAEIMEILVNQELVKVEKRCKARIEESIIGLNKRFSSINFFLELGDVSSLIKRLDKYRYVDYQFGIAPMIGDIKNISNGLSSSISAVNARLDSYRQPQAFRSKFKSVIPFSFPGGTQVTTATTQGLISLEVVMKGFMSVELPILSRYNRDYTIWLDQIGFHPDLATVYEAIPFSWMIDWFVPIGNYLESMSSSWLNPQINFTGSISTKYTFSGHTDSSNPNTVYPDYDIIPGQRLITFNGRGYKRTPVSSLIVGSSGSKFVLGLGLDSLSKTALLSDIFGPTKAAKSPPSSRNKYLDGLQETFLPGTLNKKFRKKLYLPADYI